MIYTQDERLLVGLQKLVSKREQNSELAGKLIAWFMTYQEWSHKQKQLALKLINENKMLAAATRKKKVEAKYWLYAITDGQDVKLGFSSNVQNRLKALQTSQAPNLKVLWKFYTGRGRLTAMNAEKCLHRHCKKYRISGEWFSLDCMELVEAFKPKKKGL